MSERGEPGWRGTAVLAMAVLSLVAVLAVAIVLAAARDDTDPAIAALTAARVDPATLPQVVPLQPAGGHYAVEVEVGPAADRLRLLLDTGAPVVLADAVAARYATAAISATEVAAVDGTVATREVVALPDLRVGGAAFTTVAGLDGFATDSPLACAGTHGILGANLMDDSVWQLDYATDELTIAASTDGLPHVDDAIAIPFERASPAAPSPIIELPAGEGSLRLVVDTGSNGWISVNPDDLVGTGIEVAAGAPATRSLGTGSAGTFESRIAWAAGDVMLGDLPLDDLPIATSRIFVPGRGNLGNAFLSSFVATIDWTSDTLYLSPRAARPRPPAPTSVTLGWEDGGFVVGAVVEGAAGADGLALRAPVIAIDGRSTATASFDDFCAYIHRSGSGGRLRIAGEPPVTVDAAPVEDFYEALAR